MQDLGTLGGSNGTASMINDCGEVVGGSWLEGDSQFDAFLWDGKMRDLGALDGCAYAFSINARSQVVGNWGGAQCALGAFLWEDGGPMVDLSTLASPIPELSPLLVININDRGEIAGIGNDASGNGHAILLIPCVENHPGVDGCDYSLVDATTAAQVRAPQAARSSAAENGNHPRTLREPSGARLVQRRGFSGPLPHN
jgi:probable HAF family extracellular repeat protein